MMTRTPSRSWGRTAPTASPSATATTGTRAQAASSAPSETGCETRVIPTAPMPASTPPTASRSRKRPTISSAGRFPYHCLQHANTVLCLATPNYLKYWDVRSLRLDLFFDQEHGKVRQVNPSDTLITVDEGATFLAIHPLIGRFQQRAAVQVAAVGEFLVVSLYDYEGPSLQFTPHEIAKLGNGFVFEVRDAEDYTSFAEFEREMRQVRILDQLYGGRRRVHYARPISGCRRIIVRTRRRPCSTR